ncbi:MAG: TonB-dependent receptor [Bacteroidota bacterium]
MKKLLWLMLLLPSVVFAQKTGSISGRVESQEGEIVGASVKIEGTTIGALTNESGLFNITEIQPGDHVLIASFVGYKTLKQRVTLNAGQALELSFKLEEDILGLENVVVSGTRYERSRKESPVVVNVVDQKIFDASQSFSVAEGIVFQPGLRVEANCQNCGFTQVRLNGLEGAYSQILINGRAVFSAVNGVYGLEQIPTSAIDRIEVVKGGGSALYGSNAIAGTINIITKDPILNEFQVNTNFSLIDGEVPDYLLSFNGSQVSDDLQRGISFFGTFRDRDYFDANADGFSEITLLENNSFGIKAFLKPSDRSKITLDFTSVNEFRRGGDLFDLPPHLTNITEQLDHQTVFGGLTYDLFSKDRTYKYSFYSSIQNTDRRSYYGGLGGGMTEADSLLASNAYGGTDDFSLVSGFQLTKNINESDVLVGGVEFQNYSVEDRIPGYNRLIDQQVNTLGIFAQYEWQISSKLKTLLGGRYDFTSVNGQYLIDDISRETSPDVSVFSPRVTMMYDLRKNLQLRASYARGFRAPQAFDEDLHISSVGGEPQFIILSEGLDKETSDAYTLSLSYDKVIGRTDVQVLVEGFHTELNNPFVSVSTGAVIGNGSILEEVRNGTGATVTGTNVEVQIVPSKQFQFQGGFTLQNNRYDESQVLFEPEEGGPSSEQAVFVDNFVRTPTRYGFFSSIINPTDAFSVSITGVYTGDMVVPRVVSETGFIDLVDGQDFFELNTKFSYTFKLKGGYKIQLNTGVQNLLNSYQPEFDAGPQRDSDFVYGPARPITLFMGLKFGNWLN